jgi:predicted permease
MLESAASFVVFLAIGIGLQRYAGAPRLNRRLWTLYFWTVAPAAIVYAYTTIAISRDLVGALVLVATSSWLVLGVAMLYGRLVGRSRPEAGALVLGAGWGNTVALGYPIAQLAYGADGLALQVLYAQFYFGVPGIAVSQSVARMYGDETLHARRRRRAILANPPLLAAVAAVTLRLASVDITHAATDLGHLAGFLAGPMGFLQLGLSIPLDRFAHDQGDLWRGAGVLGIRHAVAPLVLYVLGIATGIPVPAVFVLAAAAPCAFHTLTLAQVYGVRPDLLRLVITVSTFGATAVILAGIALTR